MPGGTWDSQNKVRPGVYIRFRSGTGSGLTVGERGTVAICEPLNWGPVSQINVIEAGEDTTPYTGYDITAPQNLFLREIFKGSNRTPAPNKVLLYRPAAASASAATATIGNLTATAAYNGTRGNDITVAVTADVDSSGSYIVETIVDGAAVDTQSATTISDLTANAWVTFSGSGALTASTGVALTGGTNGTVAANAYSSALTAFEAEDFDVLIYDGEDITVAEAYASFVKRMSDSNGVYCQLAAAGMTAPDSRFVINVDDGVQLNDGTTLTPAQVTWWVGGATAGAKYNQSLTYARYPGAVAVTSNYTNSQIISKLNAGMFVLVADNGEVHVEQDINSLTTYTTDIGKVYRKNRVIRLCNTIANDLYRQFTDGYIGIVNNNEAGRSTFQSAIVGYLLDVQANEGIQNFSPEDVEVLPGTDIDSIVVNIALQAVDAVEKIYITITMS